MNWESIFTEAVLGLVGIVITAVGTYVSYWISTKIKDDKLKRIANSLHELVRKATLEVYQTYVEALKCEDAFDAKSQRIALLRAVDIVKRDMTPEVEKWLKETQGDFTNYIESMIEAQIALLKK